MTSEPVADASAAQAAVAVSPKKGRKDVNVARGRWWHRSLFVFGSIGASIGLPNIWNFPALTFKHTGPMYLAAYIGAIIVVGWPMHILESTLGQKMQRGSAGSLRGITPRLGGVGWVASFCGLVMSFIYTCLLGLNLYYFVVSNSEPWNPKTYVRPLSCETAEKAPQSSAELYLYFNVVKILDEKTCEPFEDGLDAFKFNRDLYIGIAVVWVLIFAFIFMGIKSIRIGTLVVVPFSFIALFVCLGHYVSMNNGVEGRGFSYYLGGEDPENPFPFPREVQTPEQLFKDAYTQVFYSMGLCMGVHYAYGSYNHIKKPVIMDSFFISFIGFFFSFIAGFMAWGAVGYLNAKQDTDQRQTSSVGLIYISMAKAASLNGSIGMYCFFLFFMFCTGITQCYAMVLGHVTNITDRYKIKTWKAALPTVIFGLIVSVAFSSNAGWQLFDLTEHFILRYIVITVGFLQCFSVGWLFEYFTTAAVSPAHAKCLRTLAVMYWIPVVVICFYANFALEENKFLGLVVICITTIMALVVSYMQSKMEFNSWYHEIVLQGVDKLSMSITSLSRNDGKRSKWMLPFETYFGICIKYINPACLFFILCHNLEEDLAVAYNNQTRRMYMYATIPVFMAVLIIIVPLFVCWRPYVFKHDVNRQFMADVIFEKRLRMQNKIEETMKNNMNESEMQKLNPTKEDANLTVNDQPIAGASALNVNDDSAAKLDDIEEIMA